MNHPSLPFWSKTLCLAETFLLFCLCLLAPLSVLPGTAWLIPAPLRLVAALSLIAFVPGYLLALLLFASEIPLSICWLAALSLIASFALLVFDGLLFDLLRFPITGLNLIASQSAWALLFLLLTFFPLRRLPPQACLSSRLLYAWQTSPSQLRTAFVLSISLAFLFIGTLTSALFAPSNETFTELYFADPSSPVPLSATRDLYLTVINHENNTRQYTLDVTTGSYSSQIPLLLHPDEAHTEHITLPLNSSPVPQLLQAALYLPGRSAPYRQVHIWLQKDSSSPQP